MIATWEKHEGQAVDGMRLLRLLGGAAQSAVYLAELDGRRCALKVVPADGVGAAVLLARWRQASELSHPHLTRLLRWGTARLEGQPVAYVAMEPAEEALADVDRPLTPKEVREMLTPAAAALAYLHGQGMAHGRIKPANLLSAGDVLKISGDAPRRIGERAAPETTPSPYDPPELKISGATAEGDAWSLGVALVEALAKEMPQTERTPPGMPQFPFPDGLRQVIDGCLQPDPALRWTMEDIEHWLRHGVPARKSAKLRYWAPVSAGAAALVVIGAVAFEHRAVPPPSNPPPITRNATEPSSPPPAPAPAETNPAPPPEEPKPRRLDAAPAAADVVAPDGAQSVLPKVPEKARLTIHGRVRISVRVEADSTGAVTSAALQSGTSKYFADLAVKASRQWKFAPGADGRAWNLRFVFTRDADHPVSVQANPAP